MSKEEFKCKAINDYSATVDDELDLKEGEIYTIMQKDPSGWWYAVNDNGDDGWVPSNYLEDASHKAQTCDAIDRLLKALKYYNLLDIKADIDNQKIFENYMNEVYKHQIYDDFYHLMQEHQNELDEIQNIAMSNYGISKCDLSVCDYSDRHFGIRRRDISNKTDSHFKIYAETMDSLHFYLLHLQDTGLRNINHEDDDIPCCFAFGSLVLKLHCCSFL